MPDAPGSRLLLVHGFTQTARSMERFGALVAERLDEHVDVTALDAPGHGERASSALDLVAGAHDLADRGGRGTWVGYSMGARFCLHVALDVAHVVERLVLMSGTAGIDDDVERSARRAADDALADEVERIGVDAFVDRWLAQPMFAGLPDDPTDRADRRRNTAAGLASSLRRAGTGTQAPLWGRLGELAVPVLVVVGERDAKFVGLGRRLAASITGASFAVVEGAGHAIHLERPEATADAVARWLRDHPPMARPSANRAP